MGSLALNLFSPIKEEGNLYSDINHEDSVLNLS